MPDVYRCPSSTSAQAGSTLTSYVVIVGDPAAATATVGVCSQSLDEAGGHLRRYFQYASGCGDASTLFPGHVPTPIRPMTSWWPKRKSDRVRLAASIRGAPTSSLRTGRHSSCPLSIDPQIIRLMVQPSDGQPLPSR